MHYIYDRGDINPADGEPKEYFRWDPQHGLPLVHGILRRQHSDDKMFVLTLPVHRDTLNTLPAQHNGLEELI